MHLHIAREERWRKTDKRGRENTYIAWTLHSPAGWAVGCYTQHTMQSEEVSRNTGRHWGGGEDCNEGMNGWLSVAESLVKGSFCPLMQRRWWVRIRNGYWSTAALSALTPMTTQCNLTWTRKVQRCWWVFRVLYSHCTFYINQVLSSCIGGISPFSFSVARLENETVYSKSF